MSQLKITLFIFLLLAASNLNSQETKRLRIAILDMKAGSGITKAEAETITSFLTTDMINSKRFHIIDRQNISQVLKEQKLTQLGCTDSACEVQVGKLLAANKILTGNVSKFGKVFNLNIFITDVEKGTQDTAEKVSVPNIENMESAAERLVERLIARIENTGEDGTIQVVANKTQKSKPQTGVIWRSAVFPGWGQLEDGDEIKASILVSSFFIGLFVYADSSINYNSAKKDLKAANRVGLVGSFVDPTIFGFLSFSQAESARNEIRSSASLAQVGLGFMVGSYLFSFLDAVLFGSNSKDPKQSFFQFYINPQHRVISQTDFKQYERQMVIEYTWRF